MHFPAAPAAAGTVARGEGAEPLAQPPGAGLQFWDLPGTCPCQAPSQLPAEGP